MTHPARLSDGGTGSLNVLLTEDDEDDYVIVRDLLREDNSDRYSLTWAKSVEDAVDTCRLEAFDAVISDFFIGPDTAADLIERVSPMAPRTPVIVISGKRDDRIDPESLRAGASAFLTKSELSGPLLDKTIRYVVERHRLFAELQDSEHRFRTLIENGPVGFLLLDDMRIVYVNPAAAGLFGLEPGHRSDGLGTLLELIREEEQAEARAFLERPAQNRVGASQEFRCVTATGGDLICDLRAAEVPWGGRWLISVNVLDVTERRQTEQRLFQAQRRETLGRLTGGVAHDFNNKLTVIIGNLDLLSRRSKSDAKAGALADRALRAAYESRETVARLLAYAREQLLEPQATDVNAVVNRVVQRLHVSFGESFAVEAGLDPDAWPVLVDREQLEAALIQLAENCRNAMPDGGVIMFETGNLPKAGPVHDVADSDSEEATPCEYVTITVSDTGPGIPEEIRTRIFEPFFTTAEFGERPGLGLSMVQGFTQQSGGYIEVDSTLGKGTSITLAFPRKARTPNAS